VKDAFLKQLSHANVYRTKDEQRALGGQARLRQDILAQLGRQVADGDTRQLRHPLFCFKEMTADAEEFEEALHLALEGHVLCPGEQLAGPTPPDNVTFVTQGCIIVEMMPGYIDTALEPAWRSRVEYNSPQCTHHGMGILKLPVGSSIGMIRLFNPVPWYQIASLPIFVSSYYAEVHTITNTKMKQILDRFPYQAAVLRELYTGHKKDFVHAEEKIFWRDRMSSLVTRRDRAIRDEIRLERERKEAAIRLRRDGSSCSIQGAMRGYRDRGVLTIRRLLRQGKEAAEVQGLGSPDTDSLSDIIDLENLGEAPEGGSRNSSKWARRGQLGGGRDVEDTECQGDEEQARTEMINSANLAAVENRIELLQDQLISSHDTLFELQKELLELEIDEASQRGLDQKRPERERKANGVYGIANSQDHPLGSSELETGDPR